MTRLKWRSIQSKEGKRDLGVRVQRWNSQENPADGPISVGSSVATRGRGGEGPSSKDEFFILCFVGHGFAEGLQPLVGEKVTLSRDAQSESEVANWEQLLKFETKQTVPASCVSWRQRVIGPWKERVGAELPMSNHGRSICETRPALLSRMRSLRGLSLWLRTRRLSVNRPNRSMSIPNHDAKRSSRLCSATN